MVTKAQLQTMYAELEERVRVLELNAIEGPIPPGDYRVRIRSVELKTSRARGRKYWQLALEVVGSPYAGWKLWANFVEHGPYHGDLNDLVRGLLEGCAVGGCRWCQCHGPRVTWDTGVDNPVFSLVGKEATATVRISDFESPNGRKHNEVKRLVP